MPRVKALVLPAFVEAPNFPGELAAWLDGYPFDGEVRVPGVPEPVRVTDRGLAVVPTGIGKTEAAATVAALFAADDLDLSSAYVLSAGIAGGPPGRTTVGAVHLADAVVDWDFKQRWDPGDPGAESASADGDATNSPPIQLPEFRPFDLVYRPDDALLAAAERIAAGVDLADSADARELRSGYPQAAAEPFVGRGTNVCGDEWWHGPGMARQVEWLVEAYDAGPYVVTESEDVATARVLERFDRLDRYLSVRAVSNFDRPAPDESVVASAEEGGGGGAVAAENTYRVASAIVEEILGDWEQWREGPPESASGGGESGSGA